MRSKRAAVVAVLLAAALTLQLAEAAGAALHAYVPDSSDDRVWRYDLATNEAIPITVGFAPIAVDGSSDGSVVVVASMETYPNAGSASVIDGATATVRWTVPVGVNPRGVGVTPDGAKAYVSSYQDRTVTVIDTATGGVVKTITLDGSLGGVAMSPNGQRVYVVQNAFGATVVSIDTATDEVTAVILASQDDPALSVATDPAGTRLFVGLYTGVAIVDAATNLLLDVVQLDCINGGCSGFEAIASNADGSRVYAGQNFGDGARVVDVAARTSQLLPSATGEPAGVVGMDVTPDGSTLYVVDRLGLLHVIDTATETVRAAIPTIAQDPLAFGEFIVGPTAPPPTPTPAPTSPAPTATPTPTPTPAPTPTPSATPTPPLLGDPARSCQKAVLDSFKTFGAKAHQFLSGCLLKLQKDHAAGAATSATLGACIRDVGPGATSRLAKARALARQRILSSCAASTPQALGRPCDPDATSIAELADCALDRQLAAISDAVAGEVAAPCGLLDLAGLAGAFPAMCE